MLEEVMKSTGETTYLSVQMGTFMRHELKCEPDRAVKISLELGKEFAIINTAIGKVFMAHSLHLQNTLVKHLEPNQREKLKEKLTDVMRDGFAQDFEEFERELNCIAVPVFDHNRLVAVLGVSGPAYRFQQRQMHDAVNVIKRELLHY